ncbi:MAG: 16S rRNA (uracil(1498)-N(3))-methyltransferase [Bdellovibrionales bacterium]|nr:16S rRNA (uracil(1498)-N(3))-methyltransferase [Bdellovibrionales bacterium]
MNLIAITETDFTSSSQVVLHGRRFEHIKNILKVKNGQKLRVGLLNGKMGWGEVCKISTSSVNLEVNLQETPPPAAQVDLIMALPRPKTLPRIVQSLTSLGVKKVAFINTWKVEKCFWHSDYLSPKALHHAMVLGLEQAIDTRLPKLEFFRLFKPFVEDQLTEWSQGKSKILCHPQSQQQYEPLISPHCSSAVLALGPEGGFVDYELEQFIIRGFKTFSLGPRILKLETAVPALVTLFANSQLAKKEIL